MSLGAIIGPICAVFYSAARDAIKKQRTLAQEFTERKPRLMFALKTTTDEGRHLARLDMQMQTEPVICANGHTYMFGEFYCADGVNNTVVYDAVTTRSETRATLVDALDGFRASDTAVRSVREDTTFVPRAESHEKRRFGCPACKSSVYSFVDPAAGEYVRCHTVDDGGTFIAHWYHRSLRTCIVCDAAAFTAFKASWYAGNVAGGSIGAANPAREPAATSATTVAPTTKATPSEDDPLDKLRLPSVIIERLRLFITRQPNQRLEVVFAEHIRNIRERLAIESTKPDDDSLTGKYYLWADALTEACRSMNMDPVLGLGPTHRRYLLALMAGRTSPPTYGDDKVSTDQMAIALLSPATLPAAVTPGSMMGGVCVGPLAENSSGVWRITEVGKQYLRSCYERQKQGGWFSAEDFSVLCKMPAEHLASEVGAVANAKREQIRVEETSGADIPDPSDDIFNNGEFLDMPLEIKQRLASTVRACEPGESERGLATITYEIAVHVEQLYRNRYSMVAISEAACERAWDEALTHFLQKNNWTPLTK